MAKKHSSKPKQVTRQARGANKRPRRKAGAGVSPGIRRLYDKAAICMRDYVSVLINPFQDKTACAPYEPLLLTGKHVSFVKGTMATGSTGFGYVMAVPNAGNDTTAVYRTGSTYAGTVLATSGTGVSTGSSNSPYRTADFSSDLEQRAVACGIRVRYIGTELNLGGRMVALEHPVHGDLNGKSFDELNAFRKAQSVPVSRDWTVVTWQPVNSNEHRFIASNIYSFSGTGASSTQHSLAIAVESTASNLFEYEYFYVFEAIGDLVTNPSTSHGDAGVAANLIEYVSQLSGRAMDRLAALPADKLANAATSLVWQLWQGHYSAGPARPLRIEEM